MRAKGTQQRPPTNETKFSRASPHATEMAVVTGVRGDGVWGCGGEGDGEDDGEGDGEGESEG